MKFLVSYVYIRYTRPTLDTLAEVMGKLPNVISVLALPLSATAEADAQRVRIRFVTIEEDYFDLLVEQSQLENLARYIELAKAKLSSSDQLARHAGMGSSKGSKIVQLRG